MSKIKTIKKNYMSKYDIGSDTGSHKSKLYDEDDKISDGVLSFFADEQERK